MTISTNVTGLNIGIESSPKTAPAVLRGVEPNSYSDTGPQFQAIARDVISNRRDRTKGTHVDVEIPFGFQADWTNATLMPFMQGVMWNPCSDKAGTAPVNGSQITVTSISSTTTYNAASGLATLGVAGRLVRAEGFTDPANNGLKLVASGSATTVVTTGLVNETPPAGAKLTLVGHQFASGDVETTLTGGDGLTGGFATLISNASAFSTGLPGVAAGEWLAVGGDDEDTFFATCPYFIGRVRSISASTIVLDKVLTLAGAAFAEDDGASMTIQIFTGGKLTNGSTRQTIHTEIQLGSGPTATQAMYLKGGVANTFTMNLPGQEKITCDFAYNCMAFEYRSGESGDEIISATRISDPAEDPFNTATDIKFLSLSIYDEDHSVGEALFAYAVEGTISINNNNFIDKALGVFGVHDIGPGTFQCDLSLNAFFETTGAMTAVEENADIQCTKLVAQSNTQKGCILDVPRGTLTAGLTLSKDQSIKAPLELMGCRSRFGHTLMLNYFAYFPEWIADAGLSTS